jgi:putative tryptophan/tyrosine transport system substrate-binding protein
MRAPHPVRAIILAFALLAVPLAVEAQQAAVPAVGFLRSTPSAPFTHLVTAFRQGLNETGFTEGQNVAVEYRWADNRLDRLPGLAAELLRRPVAVIVGNSVAAQAAKATTATIPIVFVTGDDPIKSGLVTNLNRLGGNVTGVTFFGGGQLEGKRVELLHELVPGAAPIAVLSDPNCAGSEAAVPTVVAAGRAIGRQVVIVKAASDREFDAVFRAIVQARAGGLVVGGCPLFASQHRQLVALVARHAIPTIYSVREYVAAGGLVSYGTSLPGAYRQAGIYVGRILKGAKPSELPVQQPTTFELAINLRTARALGLTIPPSVLARADEMIQ